VGAQINAVFMGLRATTYDLSRTFELAYQEQDPDVERKRKTTPPRFTRRVGTGVVQGPRQEAKTDERP